ncbi:hypothetical protein CHUAL_003210 [Chamberlinius hualienensis]
MFGKKSTFDPKKATQKFLDHKKDTSARLKHLKHILENVDVAEAKSLFESNYSNVYHVFYDQFISVEANLKQRANKSYREELDIVLHIFEKILTLLPELLSRKWMCHSLSRLMKKLLHPENALKLRRDAVRLFIIWYQILGDNAPLELHWIFACLVPGFQVNHESGFITLEKIILGETNVKHSNSTAVSSVEICPILPPQSGDSVCEDHSQFFLECIMDFIVTQVTKIEWRDKGKTRQQKCFQYLFGKFKFYYLPVIFSDFSDKTKLPELRTCSNANDNANETGLCTLRKSSLIRCKVVVVRWVANFTHNRKLKEVARPLPYQSTVAEENSSASTEKPGVPIGDGHMSKMQIAVSSTSDKETQHSYNANEDMMLLNNFIVKDTLYSNRENVNFIQEVFRQALLLPWSEADTMKRVVVVYRDWISKDGEKPAFMLEPYTAPISFHKGFSTGSVDHSYDEVVAASRSRLRNDSYLGAIYRENINVRAGWQNCLQVFITNVANVFLQEVGLQNKAYLHDQVEICKHVLNIYRIIVMEVSMDQSTWEQLLLILLHITSQILGETLPVKKEDTLGGVLAPAVFQTLIVTWIKANLNVAISIELWDQFLHVLSSLTHWEELIREWAKTMEVLTKVLGRLVYNLDLNDLPLDRLSEQKQKRKRAGEQNTGHHMQNVKETLVDGSSAIGKDKRLLNDFVTSKHAAPMQHKKLYGNRCRSISGDVTEKQVRQEIRAIKKSSLRRSLSETNLSLNISSVVLKKYDSAEKVSLELELNGIVSADSELEVAKILASAEEYIKESGSSSVGKHSRVIRKSKSMEALRFSQAPTPSLSQSSVDAPSRSPSPSPSGGLETSSMKDSPMQIDGVSGDHVCPPDDIWDVNKDELRSVMSGGSSTGWLPDVAVALWRRMIGALGDINKIRDPAMHARVFSYLVEMFETLIKLRENQGVTADNLSTPEPPELIPPLNIISPWLFKAISLPNKYKLGKLNAFRLLCCMTIRHHDVTISRDHLVQFYNVLHSALCGTDQEVINTIVKYCGPRFFSLKLPGSSLLLLDFIHAADKIISSTDVKDAPRTEAMSILGAIICFPLVYVNIPVLKPNSWEKVYLDQKKAKDNIVGVLLKSGCKEPVGLARCVALSSLAIYLYEELTYNSVDGKLLDSLNVLLAALKQSGLDTGKSKRLNEITTKAVGQVVCDMLFLLTDHTAALLKLFPDVPKRIIEVLAATLNDLLQQQKGIENMNRDHEQLVISLMFCLGEWCMQLQKPLLCQECSSGNSLLHLVFNVLYSAYSGVEWSFESSSTFNGFSFLDFDYNLYINNLVSEQRDSRGNKSNAEIYFENQTMSNAFSPGSFYNQRASRNLVKLAARSIMTHLVNHLNHFPMGIGASRLTSMLNENDDNPGVSVSSDDLSLEVFNLPNVQTLISFVELPMLDVPGGGVTAGTKTAKSQVRVIVRDVSGKFSWDASVLYGPSNMETICGNEYIQKDPESKARKMFFQDFDEPPSIINPSSSSALASLRQRSPDVLPVYDEFTNNENTDNLSDLLQYIGHTSTECLYRAGQPLNIPQGLPPRLTHEVQDQIMNTLLNQRNFELDYINRRKNDNFMLGSPVKPSLPCDPESPFQHCRLMINQMGLMAWDKRSSFDLLKKNEKLLRELRNLDKQKCRETHKIAVIYVAEGQEDKNSLLMNTGGGQAYEEFVAGLAWEVELKNHNGFMGGLQGNGSTGDTAPYYANSFLEVIFHVATRMPSNSEESKIQKLRHLGNDEVHIVWSEHNRDYRRGIITTEFGDVVIAIYPLPNKLYRIQISRKPQVPFFGPLFDGAIVDHKILPGLVRATAINASRATRMLMPAYQPFYKERARSLETIIKNHKDASTFEEFTANVIMPNHQRTSQTDSVPKRESGSVIALSNLAAALLDSNSRHSSVGNNSPVRSYPNSVSSTSDQSNYVIPHEAYNRVSESFDSGDNEDKPTSPKASKRLSLKGNVRKSSQSQRSTPPESPTPKVKK